LAIGHDKDVKNRKFKVNWGGQLFAEDGVFSGTIYASTGTIGGWSIGSNNLSALNGSVIFNSETGVLSGAGIITGWGAVGGWTINQDSLQGGDTILHSEQGIVTNNIKIKEAGASWNAYYGGMGYVGANFQIGEYNTPGVALYLGRSEIRNSGIFKITPDNLGFSWSGNTSYTSYMSLNSYNSTGHRLTFSLGGTNSNFYFKGNSSCTF